MSMKKILAAVLCVAMVLGTMGTVAFAEEVNVATVNGVGFSDIQEAIKAAAGDIITVENDIYVSNAITIAANDDITLDLNGKVIAGNFEQSAASKVFDVNGKLTVKDSSAEQTGKITSHATNPDTGAIPAYASNTILVGGEFVLESGTIENLSQGGASYAVDVKWIASGSSDITIKGGNVEAVGCAIRAVAWQKNVPVNLTIEGGEITAGRTLWIQLPSAADDVKNVNVKISGGTLNATGRNGDFLALYSYSFGDSYQGVKVDVTGGTINGDLAFGGGASYNGSGAETVNISGGDVVGDVYTFNTAVADKIEITGGTFTEDVSEYLADGLELSKTATGYEIVTEEKKVDTIEVEFKKVDSEEGELLYNINLVGADGDIINRLNSADLTFDFDPTAVVDGKMKFEIIDIADDNIHVAPVNNSKVRYEFHFDTKTGVNDTANSITIAQVKFTGYGTFDFAVDSAANETNVVHATTISDNLVDTFVVNGAAAGLGTLDISAKLDDVENTVPTRKLTVEITFPNAIEYDNSVAYQDMKVTIVGGNQNIEVDLAAEADYTFTKVLPYNTAYTVTVSGAGYRTATYTVQLTEDKTLNFWNNVMDRALEVEVKNSTSKTVKNFLAGDIVGDDEINIYDLSAAVSYFGTNTKGDAKYSKYDLNRDGKIDSKDVAFILVSWGE